MAVGDIIAAAAAVTTSFQPASGVEIILTSIATSDGNWIRIEDSVTDYTLYYYGSGAGLGGIAANAKVGITNSYWLKGTNALLYSGVQTK